MHDQTLLMPSTLFANAPTSSGSPLLFFAAEEETLFPPEESGREEERDDPIDDAVWLYLRDISRFPLLTVEQEQRLAHAIASATAERRRPVHQQRRSILHESEEAMEQLINANLRLVVSIARRYRPRSMSMLDLIQEGNLGLMHAAPRFDVTKGHRFSTYATWWIRQHILRALTDKDPLVRLPSYLVELLRRLTRISEGLVQELGREPTVEELATAMGVSGEKIRAWTRIADPISLHATIGEEGDAAELGDFLAAPGQDPAEEATDHLLHEQMLQALELLSPREYTMLAFHYGLHDGRSRTFEEIGTLFHLTRQRIRQIEAKALRTLRQSSQGRLLRETVDGED